MQSQTDSDAWIQRNASPGLANTEAIRAFNRQWLASNYPTEMTAPPQSVGVVGGGTMGVSIAASVLAAGIPVVLADTLPDVLATAPARIDAHAFLSGIEPSARGSLVTTTDLDRIARCDLIVETIVENPAIKQQLYADIEGRLAEHSILATNTSTLPLRRLRSGLADPGRFCGIHFFHPIAGQRLVEVIRTEGTRPETVALAVRFIETIDHLPLVVDDAPGFLVNRLVMAYTSEALELVMEGHSLEEVDQAATELGMLLGPILMLDSVGLQTALNCAWVFSGAYPDVVPTSPLLMSMVKAGRLGRKTLQGFYRYRRDVRDRLVSKPDPEAEAIIQRWAGREVVPSVSEVPAHRRLALAMLLEAVRIIEAGDVADARLLDVGAVFGLGFPAEKGGLLFWADQIGAGEILRQLEPLAPLGSRMHPPARLTSMASRGDRFYSADHRTQ